MIPAPTTRTGSPSDGGRAEARGRRSRPARAGRRSESGTVVGERMQHRGVRQHLLAHPPPSSDVYPSVRPRLSDPAVEIETRGRPSPGAVRARADRCPERAHGMHGIDGHPGPDREGALRVRSRSPARRSRGRAGRGSTPSRPARATAPRSARTGGDRSRRSRRPTADTSPCRAGSSGSGRSTSDAGNAGSAMSNWTARTAVSVGAFASRRS